MKNKLFRAPPYLPCGHSVSLLLWNDVEGWIWKPSATESYTERAEEEDKNMETDTPVLCDVMWLGVMVSDVKSDSEQMIKEYFLVLLQKGL